MRRTSSATLELPEDTLVMLSFHFLFMRKPTPACPLLASEWYSRWPLWRVVKLSYFLRTSPSPITSHFMLFSFSSSSSSCTCSSFCSVLKLYVAIILNSLRVTNNKDFAKKFNEFFVNIGSKLANSIKSNTNDIPFTSYLKNKTSSTFSFFGNHCRNCNENNNELSAKEVPVMTPYPLNC